MENLENKQVCFWLGTVLKEEQIPEAEGFLNEMLEITSCKILFHNLENENTGLSFVVFTIDSPDIHVAAITRLRTNDIKWDLDYPEYNAIFLSALEGE